MIVLLQLLVLLFGVSAMGVAGSEGESEQVSGEADSGSEASAQEDSSDEGQPAGEGEADKGSAAPESFSSIDPNSLSPELQQIYKSMQADYTRKTQEIAEFRKQQNAFQQAMALPSVQKALYEHMYGQSQPAQSPQGNQTKEEPEVDLSKLSNEEIFERAVESIAEEKLQAKLGAITPIQNALLANHVKTNVESAVVHMNNWTKENNLPPFENFRQQIAAQFASPQDPTGDQTVQALVLNGQLVPALETMYKTLAFEEIKKAEKTNAREELNAKKKANIPSSSISPERTGNASEIDFSKGMNNAVRQAVRKNLAKLQAG